MPDFECSGRTVHGDINPWGCRKPAIGGFVGENPWDIWLFCGEEHTHPAVKPMERLVWEVLGMPRYVGEPLLPDDHGPPPEAVR